MSERSHTEKLARMQITEALQAFGEAQELREEQKSLVKRIQTKLEHAQDCLEVVKQLRWGKDLIEQTIGPSHIYYKDLLRLFEGDARP